MTAARAKALAVAPVIILGALGVLILVVTASVYAAGTGAVGLWALVVCEAALAVVEAFTAGRWVRSNWSVRA